jgi:hypothetical protein
MSPIHVKACSVREHMLALSWDLGSRRDSSTPPAPPEPAWWNRGIAAAALRDLNFWGRV